MKLIRLILLPSLFLFWAGCGGSSSGGGGPIEDPSANSVKQIILAPEAQRLQVGEEKPVRVQVLDESGRPVGNVELTWSVSDPLIAGITPDGEVKGLQAGQTTVTASYKEVRSNSIVIEVLSPARTAMAIELDTTPVEIHVNSNKQFTAVVLNTASGQALDVAVSWHIADPAIASVVDGVVTGLKVGQTTLTASYEALVSEPVNIVVSAPSSALPVDSVKISPQSAQTLEVGKGLTFSATAFDRLGQEITAGFFTWTISDETVASVDPEGTVIGIRSGSAQLTASAQNKTSPPVFITVASPPPPPPAPPTPKVTGFYPSNSGVVTPESRPTATFSANMDPSSLPGGFTLQSTSGPVAGTATCNTDCTVATFIANAPFAEGTYTATLSTQVKSDRAIALEAPSTWSFTVRNRTVATCQPAPRETNGWEMIKNQEPLQDLWGVHFINECEGWTVGMEMTLAHTIDGGVTWERQSNVIWKNSTPAIPPDLYDVFFLDANIGWAAGWPEVILTTTDGGATWKEQFLNLHYTTPANFCGQWNDDRTSCLKKNGTYLRRIRFADPQNGWVVGRFGTLYRTINGGASWTNPPQRPANPVDCAANPTRPIGQPYTPHWFGLDVQSANEIWISGGSDDGGWCTGWNRAIIHTTDGGVSWTYQNDHPGFGGLEGSGRYQDIRLIGNFGWAVGEVGTILRTIDHGATWERISGTGAGGSTLFGLSFVDPMNVWITGSNGVIVHSRNANAPTRAEIVWTKQASGTGTQLRRSSFVNPSFGWVAGQFRLFRTTTGGNPLPPPGP